MTNRREFLRHGALAVAGLGALRVPRWLDRLALADPDAVRALAMRAIDAAKAAGATYADARLTRTLAHGYGNAAPQAEGETLGVAVRALDNGYWGFAASPDWEADEVTRLAKEAVSQAKAYGLGTPRAVDWSPMPAVTGAWSMPVRYDPFTIPIEEKADFAASWLALALQLDRHCGADSFMSFTRQERAVATTDGSYVTQTTYKSSGRFTITVNGADGSSADANAVGLSETGAGWELFLDAKLPDQVPALLEQARATLAGYPSKSGDIGRYAVVFDAATMAGLVGATLGIASQADRILGYESNAGGVSYLGNDPLAALGTLVASPLVSITADRTMPRGLSTVKWDDEGVPVAPFPLVKAGVLVDCQTTREQAAWLAPWYQKHGQPARSRGCAAAESALYTTMQHLPNLILEPARTPASFEELVASTPRGIAVIGGRAGLNIDGGQGVMPSMTRCREIVNGKLGMDLTGIMPVFGAADLWKHVVAVGGPASARMFPMSTRKGEPQQLASCTISAVPAKVTNMAFIDSTTRL
jgi:TldD protein